MCFSISRVKNRHAFSPWDLVCIASIFVAGTSSMSLPRGNKVDGFVRSKCNSIPQTRVMETVGLSVTTWGQNHL